MNIKILGGGCANCKKLEKNVRAVVTEKQLDATIEKVTDYAKIAEYGIISTPGLIVNDKIVSYGKVNSVEEIIKFLSV